MRCYPVGVVACTVRGVQCCATVDSVIRSFAHKGLAKFFATGSRVGIIPQHAERLKDLLAALDTATRIEDLNLPDLRLHQLKGDQRGRWAITVRANWRLTFDFDQNDVHILDYEDYH